MPQTTTLGEFTFNWIGLGTNRLTDTPENREFPRAALDAGVSLIDTALPYTDGESERTTGPRWRRSETTSRWRRRAATTPAPAGPIGYGPSSSRASSSFEPRGDRRDVRRRADPRQHRQRQEQRAKL